MLTYIFFGLILSIVVVFILSKLSNIDRNKFKKIITLISFFIFFLICILVVRIYPALLSAIPAFFLFIFKWRSILFFLKGLIQKSYSKKKFNNLMTKKEALDILGLDENPSKEEILSSYHKLLKKNHPDLGGSDWITSKLNKAKETLLE